jgi:hypothetical protein
VRLMVSLLRLSAKAMAPRVAFFGLHPAGCIRYAQASESSHSKSIFNGEAMWCRDYAWEGGREWERGREWGREWEWEWEWGREWGRGWEWKWEWGMAPSLALCKDSRRSLLEDTKGLGSGTDTAPAMRPAPQFRCIFI